MLRGMMWADNCCLFCDNKERLVCMVNDVTQKLLDSDMHPKHESLWWTSSHKGEDMTTLKACHSRRCSMSWVIVLPQWEGI